MLSAVIFPLYKLIKIDRPKILKVKNSILAENQWKTDHEMMCATEALILVFDLAALS